MYSDLVCTVCKTEEEWRKLRNKAIGGSDAATVLNLNPYRSAFSLWLEKTGQLAPDDISQNESVRLGNELEDYVARRFAEETGKKVDRMGCTLSRPDIPFAHANIDRILMDEDAGLECKTTSHYDPFEDDEIPDPYYCQCLHYMMVTGVDHWYLAVLFMGFRPEFRWYCIKRNEAEITALKAAESDFWDHVKNNTPVAIGGSESDSESVGKLFPGDDSEEIDLTAVETQLRNIADFKAQRAKIDSAITEAENGVKLFLGNATKGQSYGFRVSWKPTERSSFDLKRFRKDHPEIDFSKYYNHSVSRRLTIKEVKNG